MYCPPRRIYILCFDISNAIMLSIPLPEIISPSIASPGEVHKSVGVLGDRICVALWDSVRLDVWVMQEYRVKESWINLFTTSRVPHSNQMPSWKPLLCFDDGKILVDYEFEDLLILDPTIEAARLVGVRDIPMGDNRESYVETIASLGSSTYLERRITDETVKNPKQRRMRGGRHQTT
ncbi:F-box protein CPR1-like [Papaver somniferum]|uniref:F-box protein CPR1-like n=1 Tax=Papaver somniferum TaxID=3469 RepID=UPI000E6F74CC|nr:F-box protein CPR1-like [Papaver somniferum]